MCMCARAECEGQSGHCQVGTTGHSPMLTLPKLFINKRAAIALGDTSMC